MKKYEKPVITEIKIDIQDVIQTSGEYLTNEVNNNTATYLGATEGTTLMIDE